MRRPTRSLVALALSLTTLGGATLRAHDFWLSVLDWRPAPGSTVSISAGVGERFPTRSPYRPRGTWYSEWRVIGPRGDVPVGEFRRDGLVMTTTLAQPPSGAYLGVLTGSVHLNAMNAKDFTSYLRDFGLDHIIAARAAAGESDADAKERYAAYAKLALRTGDGDGAHLIRPIGVRAELVPASDPTRIRPGDVLRVQLLTDGKPIPDVGVDAVAANTAVRGRTDADGRIAFTIDRAGAWLIRTVYIVRLSPPHESGASWESYYVTLAFHVAE